MKFMRRTAGYTLFDHKRSEDILKELQIETSHHTCPELPYQLEEPCKKNGESENSKATNNICT
jgi:hypothetical protein